MKWPFKLLVLFVILMLLSGIAGGIYLVYARMQGNEYLFQVDAVLSAALIANGNEPVTDPDRAVIAAYNGQRAVIVPGNYTALSSYLRKDAVHSLIRPDGSKALTLTVCGQAVFTAAPADEKGDQVLVQLETQGKTLVMHLRGGNLWPNLLACCLEGTYHDRNLPAD